MTYGAFIFTFSVLVFIIAFILFKGVPHLKPSLFSLKYTSENVSLMPALISTLIMTAISIAISVPLGVFSAIYLVEYAKRGNKVVNLIRLTTETLSGIPSIIYGLFGLLFFVTYLGWGFSVLAGSFTLSIMILPLIIPFKRGGIKGSSRLIQGGLIRSRRGKAEDGFQSRSPAAIPGIFAGIILAVGRIVGETAALIYTAGTVAQVPKDLLQSARTLSVHMFALSSEGLHTGEAYATAVVLLILVVVINTVSAMVAKRIGGKA